MESIVDRLNAKITEKSLLKHPFYQAWQRGELTLNDLRRYAEQYYFFEANLPRFLSGIHANCFFTDVRKVILENLWDEEHGEENHLALWIDFCKILDLNERDVSLTDMYLATRNLVTVYSLACLHSGSFREGLVAVYAYEAQVPEIARVKMEGLKQFYGITDEKALKFFVVHSELDKEHSFREAKMLERYALLDARPVRFGEYAELVVDKVLAAWWNFLDGIEMRRV